MPAERPQCSSIATHLTALTFGLYTTGAQDQSLAIDVILWACDHASLTPSNGEHKGDDFLHSPVLPLPPSSIPTQHGQEPYLDIYETILHGNPKRQGLLTHSRGEELLFQLFSPWGGAIVVHQNAVREDPKELHWQPQRPRPLPGGAAKSHDT